MVEQKSRMSVLKALLVIVESSQFSGVLAKDDKDKVNELSTLLSTLNLTISETESQIPKYIELFRK